MEQGERRMTKDEIQKNSEHWYNKYKDAEKRIAELKAEVTRLRNENLDIINKYTRFAETDRRTIAELKEQIEKMKCCRNCKKFMIEGVCGHFLQVGWCKNWELAD